MIIVEDDKDIFTEGNCCFNNSVQLLIVELFVQQSGRLIVYCHDDNITNVNPTTANTLLIFCV